MGLFDIFTGAPAKKAAQQTRGYLDQVKSETGGLLNTNLQRGIDYSQAGTNQALGYINDWFPQGRTDITQATDRSLGALQGYTGSAADAFRQQSAVYDPLAQQYGAGSTMYSNALGLNGAPGVDAARSAFQAGPGYQFAVDQGLEAINRRRAAAGELAGGNADREAQTYGQGLANQEYGNYLTRLQGFQPLQLQAASGQAAGLANTGNLYANTGAREADVISTGGRSLADLASRQGLAGAQVAQGGGQNIASLLNNNSALNTQLALGVAQPYTKSYSDEANAQLQGSKNLWDLGLNLAKAGTGSGFFGGGGAGGSSSSFLPSMNFLTSSSLPLV